MSEHAQGPVEIGPGGEIKTLYGRTGMDQSELIPVLALGRGRCRDGNARRIVSLWNACEGIGQDLLDMVVGPDLTDEPLTRLFRLKLAVETALERAQAVDR